MLDVKAVRNDVGAVISALKKRDPSLDLHCLLEVDDLRKNYLQELEKKRAQKKNASEEYRKSKLAGLKLDKHEGVVHTIGQEIKTLEADLAEVESRYKTILLSIPNIPDPVVPAGGKENNQIIRFFGKKPEYEFSPKDHVEIAENLGLIDYKRGVKLGGNGSWIYKGAGAQLEWALLNFFIESHVKSGYEFILPPHMLNYENGLAAGQFPKFKDEVYFLSAGENNRKKFLLPTSETAILNLHRDEILASDQLPLKYCSYTPCYRVEVGSYRKNERGTLRGHQFNKVELFQFTTAADSDHALDDLIQTAEKLIQDLGVHYRVSQLAAGDCSFAMAQTIDLEVWIPSIGQYKEVSSASTARDFQARRGNIKSKNRSTGKNEFVHTLNASGLATSRLVPAILEQNQQADGSVLIPEVLQRYLGRSVLS